MEKKKTLISITEVDPQLVFSKSTPPLFFFLAKSTLFSRAQEILININSMLNSKTNLNKCYFKIEIICSMAKI